MQVIYPSTRPSPLEGFGEGMQTLAEAVIKSREKQAFSQDTTLVGQALAQAQGGGQEAKDYGDVPDKPQGEGTGLTRQQAIAAFQGLLPQMKSQAGQQMVAGSLTKMIMAEKQDVTTYYDPATGETKQFAGKLHVAKPENQKKVQTVKVQEGGEEVTYEVAADGSRKEIGRGPKWNPKEAKEKQVLLESEEGRLEFFPEGSKIPQGWSKPASGGKKGFTGRTKEGVDFLKLMGMDPTKAESWKFVKETLGRGNTDVSKWAMQQAVAVAKGDVEFMGMSPAEKKNYIKDQSQSFMDLAAEMQGKGKGGGGGASPQVLSQEFEKARGRVESMPDGPAKDAARQKLAAWKAKHLGQ